jgi:hypothetical protein
VSPTTHFHLITSKHYQPTTTATTTTTTTPEKKRKKNTVSPSQPPPQPPPHRYNTTNMNTSVRTNSTWTKLSYVPTPLLQHLTTTTVAPTKNHHCQNRSGKHYAKTDLNHSYPKPFDLAEQ